MPALAMLRHDLHTLAASWLVRLWLAGSALLTLFLMMSNWETFQTAPLIALLLLPYLVFPWLLVAIVLGVGPVTGSRADALADGILSRPVTRYEFLVASWAARVMVVLGVYLVVMVPAIVIVTMAQRPPATEDSVTFYGILASLYVVGLVLTFLVSLGFLMGTLLRKPLLAVVVLVFAWCPINLILAVFDLEEFSPISLNQAIPTLLRQPWRQVEEDPQTVFSQEDFQSAAKWVAHFGNVFPSQEQAPAERSKDKFFERDDFEDFSLARVTVGYGVPGLAAIGLAMLCFCWRDL